MLFCGFFYMLFSRSLAGIFRPCRSTATWIKKPFFVGNKRNNPPLISFSWKLKLWPKDKCGDVLFGFSFKLAWSNHTASSAQTRHQNKIFGFYFVKFDLVFFFQKMRFNNQESVPKRCYTTFKFGTILFLRYTKLPERWNTSRN